MKLNDGIHLAYCTNVHRGETWAETFAALERHTLMVRQRVARGRAYAIGLRLGQRAAEELAQPAALLAFRQWLDRHDCYVFTINGFPYGSFHGTRVKEQVYAPDWSTPERVTYTERLFELLVQLLPAGVAGSVSTVPGSFKAFVAADPGRRAAIFTNLTACARSIAALAEKRAAICTWDSSPSRAACSRRARKRLISSTTGGRAIARSTPCCAGLA